MKKIFTLLTAVMLCVCLSLSAKPIVKDKAQFKTELAAKLKIHKAPAKLAAEDPTDTDLYNQMMEDYESFQNYYAYLYYFGDYYYQTSEEGSELEENSLAFIKDVYNLYGEACGAAIEAYEEALETRVYESPADDFEEFFIDAWLMFFGEVYPSFVDDYNKLFDYADQLSELEDEYPDAEEQIYTGYVVLQDALDDVLRQVDAVSSEAVEAIVAAYSSVDPDDEEAELEIAEIQGYVTPESVNTAFEKIDEIISQIKSGDDPQDDVEEIIQEDVEFVNSLLEFMDEVKDSKEFPAYAKLNAEKIEAASEVVDSLYVAVNDAYCGYFFTGKYDRPDQSLFDEAYAAAAMLFDDMAEQSALILTGYYEDMDVLSELYAYLAPYIEDEDDIYSNEVRQKAADIEGKIFQLKDLCDQAEYKALTETGVYESPLTDEDLTSIKSEIDVFLATTGINAITNDAAAEKYYDLNGKVVANPAAGNVYIRVANGKATKVIK